jgi:hypothetical protein
MSYSRLMILVSRNTTLRISLRKCVAANASEIWCAVNEAAHPIAELSSFPEPTLFLRTKDCIVGQYICVPIGEFCP